MAQPAPTAPQSTNAPLTPTQTPYFENGMTILLNTWPALSMAVENEFGGPDSADKRDWMCGAVADLFSSDPTTDAEDLEDFLLQILSDEFETALEDDSAYTVSQRILLLRRQVAADDFSGANALNEFWEKNGGRNKPKVKVVKQGDSDDDEEEGDEDGEEGGDMEMDEAPQLVAVKERVEKVVDEDGFELVQKRRR
ncbi:hypothetical protein TWF106_001295 [Orbilia oligospora]|uniref:Pre-rRNA-processing protein TSR2 n=1 Tax=Orbilia oligospora TaxID=2813651 RepID=A0A6G1LRH9_ORBOL|nr:hypothetical protein TWF679_006536 [Orbilia oligospora]KAF3217356.1 hypothetical protein TWF191_008525 [Orbilia oligospora]KAF3226079.1 hypothetical protein TWF106_001295 [Orbilia oligospora]KAF3232732.1 hypothetical protein TWF192_002867 [Orbilia oligospora]